MRRLQHDVLFKSLFVGNSGVGKTSLLRQFTRSDFIPSRELPENLRFKTVTFDDGAIVQLQLWDISGDNDFVDNVYEYYRACSVIHLVFDVTNRKSFEDILQWYDQIQTHAPDYCIVTLIGNKIDLTKECEVSQEEAEKCAEHLQADYFETCAVTGECLQRAVLHGFFCKHFGFDAYTKANSEKMRCDFVDILYESVEYMDIPRALCEIIVKYFGMREQREEHLHEIACKRTYIREGVVLKEKSKRKCALM